MSTEISLRHGDPALRLAIQDGEALIADAESLDIFDPPSYQMGAELRRKLKALINGFKEHYKPIKKREDDVHKATVAEEKQCLAGPEAALVIVNDKLQAHERAMARERLIAEARAAEEAKRLEAARPLPPAGTAPLPPIIVPAAHVEIPKVEGLSFSTHYKGRVLDKSVLIRAVADGQVSDSVLDAVEAVLTDWARSAGPQTEAAMNPGTVYPMPGVPGVGVVAERRPRG